MNNIFGQESKFFKVMNTLGSIIGVSIMWLICCIPIVTIGASTIALYYTTAKAIRHETGYLTGEFKKSFKNNLKDGVIITVIYLFLVAVLYVDYMVINNLNSSFAVMLGGMYMLITLVMFGVFVYIFPAMSRFTMGKLGCFKLALLMTFKHLPSTIFTNDNICNISGTYIINSRTYDICYSGIMLLCKHIHNRKITKEIHGKAGNRRRKRKMVLQIKNKRQY